ncbi:hypothetical protein P5673_002601 [Acropora cervicornis]|uniref:Uncharacterized protein n=1 Tax=Acropora cervicornis TaxID=6130 RepID=A0AAD9R3H2_ACRCE|nr:hypothetical protein P5673_002601 [Acropora cervicornis]
MMWFQTLKTKQTIRSICTQNGQGQVAGLEYTDKKSEVHALKREIPPLMLDEGVTPAFLTLENGGMCMLGISLSGKGKCCLEIKAWDLMSSLGFTAKEITVQDLQRNTTNDGKFKAVINLPETQGIPFYLKMATFMDFLSIAVSSELIFIWKYKKVENIGVSLELIYVLKSCVAVQDIAFIANQNTQRKGPPSVVLGEPGGVKIYTAAQQPDVNAGASDLKYVPAYIPFPTCDIQNYVKDTAGRLWYLNPPYLREIVLPSSQGGYVFAVQPSHDQAEEVIKSSESGLIVQPWHVILSHYEINTLSFIEENVLAAGSHSAKSMSLWVGIDSSGFKRLEVT